MTPLANNYAEFNALLSVLSQTDQYEVRFDNDTNGNALYIGRSIIPSSPTIASVWAITKLHYDTNGFLQYVQLPDNEQGFKCAWDLRANYFS